MSVWPAAVVVEAGRLRLEPLRAGHANEAYPLLDDVRLHAWTGGTPPSREELGARFRRQAVGHSPDGTRGWLNWMVRRTEDARLVGMVQATLDGHSAEVAWVVGADYQGLGYGREAALAMVGWLRGAGVDGFVAHIHPDHRASEAIARALGMAPTGTVVDGEVRWSG